MPIGPPPSWTTPAQWDPTESIARGRRRAELDAREATDGYRARLIPAPPFQDDSDRDAALGAALVMVGHQILGRWPAPESIARSVQVLTAPDVLDEERRLMEDRRNVRAVLTRLKELHRSAYIGGKNTCESCQIEYPCPTAKVIGELK